MYLKFKNWIIGRKFLYLLNAYTDAWLASELVKISKGIDAQETFHPRIQALIDSVDRGPEMILGIAYCQYYFNGWYDYICGKLFEKISPGKTNLYEYKQELDLKDSYSEINIRTLNLFFSLFWPLIYLLIGKLPNSGAFVERFNIDAKGIDKKDFLKACVITQKENIKNNSKQLDAIQKNSSRKAKYINDFALFFGDKEQVVTAVKKTLRRASLWDRIFAAFLNIRFF